MKLVRDWRNKAFWLVATHANKQPDPSDKRLISHWGQQHCLGPGFFEIGGHHFLWAYFVIEYRQNNLPWKSWGSQKQQIIKGHTGPQGSSRFVLSHTHKPMFHIAVVETNMSHMSILRIFKNDLNCRKLVSFQFAKTKCEQCDLSHH